MARVLLIADESIGATAAQGTQQWAQGLADYLGEPVGLAFAEPSYLEAALQAAEAGGAGAYVDEVAPAPQTTMSSADFVWLDDGRPDWGSMWQSFCELALFGGPPHRGEDSALRHVIDTRALAEDFDPVAEIRRGIFETTGLYAEPADEDGWLAVTCESTKMAAWLAAAIILENVDARFDEERLLVPASPSFALKDEVKSVITVLAKTHHYWLEHAGGGMPATARVATA